MIAEPLRGAARMLFVAGGLLAAAPPSALAQAESTTLVPPPVAHSFGVRRVTQRQLALAMPGVKLGSPGGVAVARLTATDDPNDRSDDDEITLVAVDTEGGAIFTSLGVLKAVRWDGSGTKLGPLSSPTDVAIDRSGLVAIADTGNRRVVILRHEGNRLVPLIAHRGFREPRGIAADGDGGFLVCDRELNAVFFLDAERGTRTTFGLEAAFDRPIDVATVAEGDRLAPGKKRVVVVSDLDGKRLRSFDPAGALKAERHAQAVGVSNAEFDAIDIDYQANVFAVDRAGNRIHKLRDDLVPLATFGSRGTAPGQFLSPRGIAIHRRFGQVFVTEEDGGQYLWIGTDVRDLRVSPEGGGVRLDYALTEESLVDVEVLDARGRPVARLVNGKRQAAGAHSGFWDGKDARARRVAAGEYTLEVRARATYASRSSFECRRSVPFRVGAAPGAR